MLKLAVEGDEEVARRVRLNLDGIWVSSVVAEEFLVVFMGGLNRSRGARNSLSLTRAHRDFAQALEDLRIFPTLVYSDEAHGVYQTFPPAILRIGAQDCRIAAQAMAHEMVVVTRNVRDFQAIGASCEDWSAS
jgi:tRNA(fMet)-specific endonuclease VapC